MFLLPYFKNITIQKIKKNEDYQTILNHENLFLIPRLRLYISIFHQLWSKYTINGI